MFFKTNCEIEISDINKNKEVTNKAIFRYLENAFCKHSESLDLDFSKLFKMGYTLVLLEWNLSVLKRPKYKDALEIITWIENTNEKVFYRNFKIMANDNELVLARAKMMIVDLKTFKPVIDEELINKHKPENVNIIADTSRLKECDKYGHEINFYIRKSDIDINNHVHNLNYLDMLKEVIDQDLEFNNIKIEFQRQIKYGDKIKILCNNKEDKYYIKVYNITKEQTSALIEVF